MMNLDNYDDVDNRIHAWHKAHPGGRITTRLEHHLLDDRGNLLSAIVSASVYRADGTEPAGTGLAQEHRAERGVNAVFLLENAETSAIGRALASAGYSTKGRRPSRQEMQKVEETRGATMGEAIGAVVEAMPGSRIIEQGETPPPAPKQDRDKVYGVAPGNEGAPSTDKQKGMIRRLLKSVGLTDAALAREYVAGLLGAEVPFEDLTKSQASTIIDALLKDEAAQSNKAEEAATDNPWVEHP